MTTCTTSAPSDSVEVGRRGRLFVSVEPPPLFSRHSARALPPCECDGGDTSRVCGNVAHEVGAAQTCSLCRLGVLPPTHSRVTARPPAWKVVRPATCTRRSGRPKQIKYNKAGHDRHSNIFEPCAPSLLLPLPSSPEPRLHRCAPLRQAALPTASACASSRTLPESASPRPTTCPPPSRAAPGTPPVMQAPPSTAVRVRNAGRAVVGARSRPRCACPSVPLSSAPRPRPFPRAAARRRLHPSIDSPLPPLPATGRISVSEQVDRRLLGGAGFSLCYAPTAAATSADAYDMQCTQVHPAVTALSGLLPRFAPALKAPAVPGAAGAAPTHPVPTLPVHVLAAAASSSSSPTATPNAMTPKGL